MASPRSKLLATSMATLLAVGASACMDSGGASESATSASAATVGSATPPTQVRRVQLGANFNAGGNMNGYARAMMSDRHASWTRNSLDVFPNYFAAGVVGPTELASDERLRSLRDAKASGFSNILTLKWDFMNYPRSGSMPYACASDDPNGEKEGSCQHRMPAPAGVDAEMSMYLAWVSDLLDVVGREIDKLVVGNEPMWETVEADRRGAPPRLVAFYRRVANRASVWKANHPDARFEIYLGSLNRLDVTTNQDADDVRGLIDAANSMPEVAGLDFHLHQPDLPPRPDAKPDEDPANSWTRYLDFVDATLAPSKKRIATEWSPVWLYNKKRTEPLGACSAPGYGGDVAACHSLLTWASSVGLSPSTTNVELFDYLQANKPSGVWVDFCDSRSWWGRSLLRDGFVLFSRRGFEVVTYALYGEERRRAILAEDDAWYLNPVFLDTLLPRQRTTPVGCDPSSTSPDMAANPCLPTGNRNLHNQFLSAQLGEYDHLLAP